MKWFKKKKEEQEPTWTWTPYKPPAPQVISDEAVIYWHSNLPPEIGRKLTVDEVALYPNLSHAVDWFVDRVELFHTTGATQAQYGRVFVQSALLDVTDAECDDLAKTLSEILDG